MLIGALDSTLRLWDAYRFHTALDVSGRGAPNPVVRCYKDEKYLNTNYCCFSSLGWAPPYAYNNINNKDGIGLVIAGSETGHVIIWDINTSKKLQSFHANNDIVLSLDCYSYDISGSDVSNDNNGCMIVTGGGGKDTSVKLWELK